MTIEGTKGNDVLVGTDGPDVIAGLAGHDTISGLKGDDIICGGNGNDKIYGNRGSDELYGENGLDVIFGGPGDDYMAGGPKRDKVSFKDADAGVNVDLAAEVATGEGNDTVLSFRDVDGSAFADTITGTQDSNKLAGKSGADLIYGKGGDDEILGGEGNDHLLGGLGADYIEGGKGADEIEGSNGDDDLKGNSGFDSIFGQNGNDSLNGGKNFDALIGGKKTDHCTSGELLVNCESGFTTFTGGTWKVPGEVPAGFYRNSSSSSGCYWARLSGFGGELEDIIANEFTFARDIAEVTGEEAGFESSSCGTWSNNLKPIKGASSSMGDGAYLVNFEVKPGLWRNSNSDDGCYWERTSGFDNTLGQITSNSFSYTIQTVSIKASDFGFTASGCGTWTRIGD